MYISTLNGPKMTLFNIIVELCSYGRHGGLAPGFDSRLGQDLSMWTVHVLPTFAPVYPPSKHAC